MDGSKNLIDDKLDCITISELFEEDSYLIPIYQRNYSWEETEIEQLIEDIISAIDQETDTNYYLGVLTLNRRRSEEGYNYIYEVIDGQQRLTTLFLLKKYLDMPVKDNSLRFEARDKSNYTLNKLGEKEFDTNDELVSEEIINGYRIIENYFEFNDINKEIFISKLEKVELIRVLVPENVDLNHYFEIMNTRGEQLELHEIAKSNILSILSDDDASIVSLIWESCSDMDSYVQMNFDIDIRRNIFDSQTWSGLNESINSFDDLKENILSTKDKDAEVRNQRDSLKNIIKNNQNGQNGQKNEDKLENEENERFKSIISFPDFLLQVNAALSDNIEEIYDEEKQENNLDDKKILNNLNKYWNNEENDKLAKDFIFNLLKCRVLFDKYIIKRSFKSGSDKREWSLEKLVKSKNNDSSYYFKQTYEDKEYKNNEYNNILLTLQAALRITYTSPKTMHWITLALKSLLDNENCDLIDILEKYAINKLKKSDYKNVEGYKFERIVFTYLDYILYRDRYEYLGIASYNKYPNHQEKYKDVKLEEGDIDNWNLVFRTSIEHFFPQNPPEGQKLKKEENLNSFGNLALVTVSGNSKFSNIMPGGKIETHKSVLNQSLKLIIMNKMMEANNEDGWSDETIELHNLEMVELLNNEIMNE